MTVRDQPSPTVIAVACLVLAVGIWALAFCAAPSRQAGTVTPTPTIAVVLATLIPAPTPEAVMAGPATTRQKATPFVLREVLLATPRPSSTLVAPTATETATPVPTATPTLKPMTEQQQKG